MAKNRTTRREFLRGGAAVAAGGAIASCASVGANTGASAGRGNPVLAFAHLTDIHVKPEGKAPNGMRACLRHAQSHPWKPEFILQGGDCIMSALGATEERTRIQFDLWTEILSEELRLPIHHCIGNHDCWGWQRSKAGTTGDEPLYGKKWVLGVHGMRSPWYSFSRAGWKFIVLDSVQERGDGGYKPMLDDAQFEWLEGELESGRDEHVLILSHVPILGVGPLFFYDDIVENYQFKVAGALMHQDTKRITGLLYRHKNVRLCLSGHVHLRDRVEYNGIPYVCNGAASGSWWHGTYKETPPGYGIVRLYADGTFENEYVTYDWE